MNHRWRETLPIPSNSMLMSTKIGMLTSPVRISDSVFGSSTSWNSRPSITTTVTMTTAATILLTGVRPPNHIASQIAALADGYHAAFAVGAAFATLAAVLAGRGRRVGGHPRR